MANYLQEREQFFLDAEITEPNRKGIEKGVLSTLPKLVQTEVIEKGALVSEIEGFPNHLITSVGTIHVKEYVDMRGRRRKEKVLKTRLCTDGYETVLLTHRGVSKHFNVHRLLAMAFIPNPENKETVNHIDGDKTNNSLDNLEWMDRSEQLYHAYGLGLKEYSQVAKTKARDKSAKVVRSFDKDTGDTLYHISARMCSSHMGKSKRWCDKIISSQNGETSKYKLEYVSDEDLVNPRWCVGSLVHLIESWSIEKGLHEGDPLVQFSKTIEEIGEIAECLTKGASENETRLEIGDAVVTLIILAQRLNLDFNVCINEAYDKIKDRKGRMIDGVFVKESDLK